LRLCELFVAPFASKEGSEECVVGLANHQQVVAAPTFFFDKNHAAALNRSLRTTPYVSRIAFCGEAFLAR
jgi:hypothetical protein